MKFKRFLALFMIFIFIFGNNFCLGVSDVPDVTSEAAILIDSKTEKVLYGKNENQKMYPASTTKIITAILTLENCDLDDIVTVPFEAINSIPSGYAIAALQAGEQLTVKQLLEVMLTHSANDAANVLAYHVSGSIEGFANLMNKKVSELGLTNTNFTNPSGIHDENHYTTAYDLAIMMKYCMKNSNFRIFAGLKHCIIPATNKYEARVFNTTNDLLTASNYYYKYVVAGKTGYTTQAKNTLVTVANKDNLELICVVLGAGLYPNGTSAKFLETIGLYNYAYDNFIVRKLREKNAIATQIEVKNGSKDTKQLDLLISEDIDVIINQADLEKEFEPNIELNDLIVAPFAEGKVLGKIVYNIDGIEYSSDLIASHDVKLSGFWQVIIRIILISLIVYFLYKLLFTDNSKKRFKKKYGLKLGR